MTQHHLLMHPTPFLTKISQFSLSLVWFYDYKLNLMNWYIVFSLFWMFSKFPYQTLPILSLLFLPLFWFFSHSFVNLHLLNLFFSCLFPDGGVLDREGRPFHPSVHLGAEATYSRSHFKWIQSWCSFPVSQCHPTYQRPVSLHPKTTPVPTNRGTFLLRKKFYSTKRTLVAFTLLWRSGTSSSTLNMVREDVSTSQFS